MNKISLLLGAFLLVSCNVLKSESAVVYAAPEGEELSVDYRLTVDNRPVPVYNAKVGAADKKVREDAIADASKSHLYYDIAGFASFDLKRGKVKLTVTVDKPIETAKILPTSFGITPRIQGKSISFEVDKPQHLTVEINGEHIRSLHIFVNPEEREKPDPADPNVIYFGPGIHHVTESVEIKDNQTLYIAGGAIVRFANPSGADQKPKAGFIVSGKNTKVLGRGIIDHENVPRTQGRNVFLVSGSDVLINGPILRNASIWTVNLQKASRVHIDNIKLLGYRSNTDGIDICDSWDVLVENCFIRTIDDLIVVKTNTGRGGAGNILAQKCVLWNEVAHALSVGAELREQVDGVTFRDCDIIGDHCREWALRVFHCDKAVVKNIRFENIRIEECQRLGSLWINKAVWTADKERGHIENVVFKDIVVTGDTPPRVGMEFLGFDETHAIKNVLIDNVVVQGKKIAKENLITNEYVYDWVVK
ncbi:glycosyl hydrolase family 28 protein [Viscerimonas tarda]